MKKRILKTLMAYLATNREVMSMEEIDDLLEQIEAVKCSIAAETDIDTTSEDS